MAVDVERSGQVATIVLNRPDVLNAFNTEQLNLLSDAIDNIAHDHAIRVVIITGSGDRAFAAGADIAEMRDKRPTEAFEFSRLGQSVCAAIESMPQPVIAAVNGFALGGGCELALACDIRICSENAQIGQPEVGLGILPGWGGTQRLTRLVGPGISKELIMTGRRVKSDEALRIGLVNAVYPPDELLDRAREMAERIAANGPHAVQASKQAINRAVDLDLASGTMYEAQLFALCFDTEDQREGMTAFLERRKTDFSGR